MKQISNFQISDEILAAYLDGKLDENQSEYVENAIENSPELQWTVDRWIEMQTADISATSVQTSYKKVISIKPKLKNTMAMAAAVLLIIVLSLPLFVKMNTINPNTGLPMDFPATGDRVLLEYPTIIDNIVVQDEESHNHEDDFSYNYEINNNALVFMWNKRVDSCRYIMYSNKGDELFSGRIRNSHITIFPINNLNASYKPIWVAIKFYDANVMYNDSIMIDY